MRTRLILALAVTLAFPVMLTSCDSDPQTITVEPSSVLLSQWETAWNNMDVNGIDELINSDFVHHLRESDWADYNGDGIIDSCWNEDTELTQAASTFNNADSIYYSLNDFSGPTDSLWGGDSTGNSFWRSTLLRSGHSVH
ncbi:MAG: hypothetical protein R6U39_08760 [Candidatus Aegiribacteria sp.]